MTAYSPVEVVEESELQFDSVFESEVRGSSVPSSPDDTSSVILFSEDEVCLVRSLTDSSMKCGERSFCKIVG